MLMVAAITCALDFVRWTFLRVSNILILLFTVLLLLLSAPLVYMEIINNVFLLLKKYVEQHTRYCSIFHLQMMKQMGDIPGNVSIQCVLGLLHQIDNRSRIRLFTNINYGLLFTCSNMRMFGPSILFQGFSIFVVQVGIRTCVMYCLYVYVIRMCICVYELFMFLQTLIIYGYT